MFIESLTSSSENCILLLSVQKESSLWTWKSSNFPLPSFLVQSAVTIAPLYPRKLLISKSVICFHLWYLENTFQNLSPQLQFLSNQTFRMYPRDHIETLTVPIFCRLCCTKNFFKNGKTLFLAKVIEFSNRENTYFIRPRNRYLHIHYTGI